MLNFFCFYRMRYFRKKNPHSGFIQHKRPVFTMQNSEVVVVGGDADGTTTRASQLDSNLQAIRDRITKATSSSRSSSIVVNATDKVCLNRN